MHAYHCRAYFTVIATCFAILLYSSEANAQYITHGPVVGAVTDSSARIYVRTIKPMEFLMSYGTDETWGHINRIKVTTLTVYNQIPHINLTFGLALIHHTSLIRTPSQAHSKPFQSLASGAITFL
jgi:hypothetical protein